MRSEKEKEKQGVAYNVSHSLVDKKVVGKVLMEKEMRAIESSKKTLLEKPDVARVKIEKMISEKGREKFYGPNLPVMWGEDLMVNTDKKGPGVRLGKRGHGDGDSGVDREDDGEDSPIEDVS